MTDPMMTCAEFQGLASDFLEPHALPTAQRAAADAHVAGCAECAALVADLRTIVRDAAELRALTPSRDLWAGVEGRIEAPVVPLAGRGGEHPIRGDERQTAERGAEVAGGLRRGLPWRRLAIAASVLVVVTAGITYTLARRSAESPLASGSDSRAPAGVRRATPAVAVAHATAEETFDHEIAALRQIVAARRAELDTATIRVVEKNLQLIDAAIAESKAALARDPASAFLLDRLTHAYDTKLQLLRGLATLPART